VAVAPDVGFFGILHFVQNDKLAGAEVPQVVELASEDGGVGANARSAMKQYAGGWPPWHPSESGAAETNGRAAAARDGTKLKSARAQSNSIAHDFAWQ
jgi:hypothetical protein